MFPLTLETCENLIGKIREGVHVEVAAALCRVPAGTLRRVLNKGLSDYEGGLETPYSAFYEEVLQTQAQPEYEAVKELRRAGAMDHTAALRYLERRYPARWAPKVRIEVAKEIDRVFDILERQFADRPELLKEIARAITDAQQGPDTDDAIEYLDTVLATE